MSDAKKEALKRARRFSAYREHLQQLQLNGIITNISDPSGLSSFDLAATANLVGMVWDGNRVARAIISDDSGNITALDSIRSRNAPTPPSLHPQMASEIPLFEVSEIGVEFAEQDSDSLQKIKLILRLDSQPGANYELDVDCVLPKDEAKATLISFANPFGSSELISHLNENSLYYSQNIWSQIDSGSLILALSQYNYLGKRVIEYIDPTPVSVAGNCVVFRWKDESDEEWQTWKNDNANKSRVDSDIVALPTGGVFAEAVLGSSNSAEKLDLTRFWNWQDSPIPIQASEIAALQAGQHIVSATPETGDFASPIVNIQNPQQLPDPTGMASVLSALTASNLFRDMSGASTTAALAQAALQASSQGATSAMGQAGSNMATAGQFTLEMAKVMVAAALGIPPMSGPGIENITAAGASVNHGRQMDQKAQDANPSPLDFQGPSAGTSGEASGGTAGVITQDGSRTNEERAFDRALGSGVIEIGNRGADAGVINDPQIRELLEWYGLAAFVPSTSILTQLRERNMSLQKLAHGSADAANFDEFGLLVKRVPIIDGKAVDISDLFRLIRHGIAGEKPEFLDPRFSTFHPYDDSLDSGKWVSTDPLGTIIRIDIPGFDDASVVCSDVGDSHWIFSTIRTLETGSHPVSGNREFGVRNTPSGLVIYTRGVDRATDFLESAFYTFTYSAGGDLWRSFIRMTAKWIADHGGDAVALQPRVFTAERRNIPGVMRDLVFGVEV